jgi:hypothetical protein
LENSSHHSKATQCQWVHDWVRVIAALHHAIDKVEQAALDTMIQTRNQLSTNHQLIAFLLLSFVS